MSSEAHQRAALERHFEGDVRLFEAFRATSRRQFEQDLVHGDASVLMGDAQALRRIGHDLKTVLQLLGDDTGSVQARQLESEALAAAPDGTALRLAWDALRKALRAHI